VLVGVTGFEPVGISRPTVIAWRSRYAREGLTGQLADRPRPGRPQTVRRDAWNQRCQPFGWVKDADQIRASSSSAAAPRDVGDVERAARVSTRGRCVTSWAVVT
jgi:hypothetical protein